MYWVKQLCYKQTKNSINKICLKELVNYTFLFSNTFKLFSKTFSTLHWAKFNLKIINNVKRKVGTCVAWMWRHIPAARL